MAALITRGRGGQGGESLPPTLDKRPSGPTVGQPPEGQMWSGQDLQAEQTARKCPQFGFE